MSVLMKKRRTRGKRAMTGKRAASNQATVSVQVPGDSGKFFGYVDHFAIPQSKLQLVHDFLHNVERGEEVAAEDNTAKPWREAFKSDTEKHTEPGLALRGARVKQGLTQKQLAERLGIEQPNVAAMESGNRPIGRAMAKRLAKELQVDYRIFL